MVYLNADNNVFGGYCSGSSGSVYWGNIIGDIDARERIKEVKLLVDFLSSIFHFE